MIRGRSVTPGRSGAVARHHLLGFAREPAIDAPTLPRRPPPPATAADRRSVTQDARHELFRLSRGPAENPDPLLAELTASTIVGMLDQPLVDLRGSRGAPGPGIPGVRRGAADARYALALLTAFAVVAPPLAGRPWTPPAAGHDPAARLARRPMPPARVTSAGEQRRVRLWSLVGVTARDGWPDHALVGDDRPQPGRMAKVVNAVRDAERVRREMHRGHRLRGHAAVAPANFVDRVTHGLDLPTCPSNRTFEEDDPDSRALVRARLRDLPPARPVEETDLTDEEAEALMAAFEASRSGAPLGDDVELAFHLLQHALDSRGDPLRWSPIVVEWCLLDWMPRRPT